LGWHNSMNVEIAIVHHTKLIITVFYAIAAFSMYSD